MPSILTASRPPRVLIAEDDPQSAELLEAYLSGTEHEIRTAGDGEEALRTIRQWQPDLVLLDIMMPKLSGFEVCRQLRADPATRGIAILMVTALDQISDMERAAELGTDDFITKPVNKTELLLRVRAALKSRGLKGDLDRALRYMEEVERGAPE
jgi:two-component system, OmpR family, alkaline phosphatase synthesis response regulator PhoP